jgi:hypothetical protein
MNFATDRPYSDPEKAWRTLVEIANSVEVVQEGRILNPCRCCWRPSSLVPILYGS